MDIYVYVSNDREMENEGDKSHSSWSRVANECETVLCGYEESSLGFGEVQG